MVQDHVGHDQSPKGLAEHGVCFSVAAGGLVLVAVALQWLLRLTM
jgi:hypothetical protein